MVAGGGGGRQPRKPKSTGEGCKAIGADPHPGGGKKGVGGAAETQGSVLTPSSPREVEEAAASGGGRGSSRNMPSLLRSPSPFVCPPPQPAPPTCLLAPPQPATGAFFGGGDQAGPGAAAAAAACAGSDPLRGWIVSPRSLGTPRSCKRPGGAQGLELLPRWAALRPAAPLHAMDSDSGELSDGDLVSAAGKADAEGNRRGGQSGLAREESPLFWLRAAALLQIPVRQWAVVQKGVEKKLCPCSETPWGPALPERAYGT